MGELRLVSHSCLGPWGTNPLLLPEYAAAGGSNPAAAGSPPSYPPVPGFIYSNFNPLAYHAVRLLLDQQPISDGDRTALLLGSLYGDTTTLDMTSDGLVSGTNKQNPLMFFQSVPNSIMGYIAKQYRITGPAACLSCSNDVLDELLDMADLLIRFHGMERVLLIGITLSGSGRADYLHGHALTDAAVALAVEPSPPSGGDQSNERLRFVPDSGGWTTGSASRGSQLPFDRSFPGLTGMLNVCLEASMHDIDNREEHCR